MGVSAKGRRIFVYKDIKFIWWVGTRDNDCDKVYLNIISEDKKIKLSYRVGNGCFVIVSKGRFFQGHQTSGCCERYPIPFKEPLMVVTTKDVVLIVQWAVDGRNAVPLTERK